MAVTALQESPRHTETVRCAIRRVFFSIRMQVAPHPDSNAAYSARNEAMSHRLSAAQVTVSATVPVPVSGLLQIDVFILFVRIPRYIEYILFPAYFYDMSAGMCGITVSGTVMQYCV